MADVQCVDKKCPVHEPLSLRGARLSGRVVSAKAKKTAIVEIDYTRYIYKYERYLRKRSRIPAYNPECINAREGDVVSIGETRRLSKTKSFAVTGVVKKRE